MPKIKDGGLSLKQRSFVQEYLIDLNATQAALRAGYSKKTAQAIGRENMQKPLIAAEISAAMAKRSADTGITQAAVLKRWWDIATADPRDLIQYQRTACPKCWPGADTLPPSERPNPTCSDCAGEGEPRIFVADSRTLSGGAALLYDGLKQTKDGLEIKVQDRSKALEMVARHLGMFNDKLALTGANGGPVEVASTKTVKLDFSAIRAKRAGKK